MERSSCRRIPEESIQYFCCGINLLNLPSNYISNIILGFLGILGIPSNLPKRCEYFGNFGCLRYILMYFEYLWYFRYFQYFKSDQGH